MPSISGRLFITVNEVTTTTPVVVRGGNAHLLEVADKDAQPNTPATYQIPAQAITPKLTGFDGNLLVLQWQEAQGQAQLHLNFDQLQPQTLGQWPKPLASAVQELLRNQRRRVNHQLSRWALLGVIVTLPLLLLIGFLAGNDYLANALVRQVPLQIDTQLGELALAQLQDQHKLEQAGARYQLLQQLDARLGQHRRFDYRWFWLESDEVNAFALPGGVVVVHSGLINTAPNPETLAAVMAHEIAHVEQRHGTVLLLKQLGLGMIWIMLTGDTSSLTALAGLQAAQLSFSRDAEQQADSWALQRLQQQQIDSEPMIEFFNTLAQQPQSTSNRLPSWLQSHPKPGERAQRLLELQQDQTEQPPKIIPIDVDGGWPLKPD